MYAICIERADILAWGPKTQTPKKINLGLDSELNSIHFGIEIDKCLKFNFSDPKISWV